MDAGASLEEYRGDIQRYLTSLLQDPVQAEDLVQETFLRAHRSMETLRDPAALKAWLYRIATNLCCDHFRRLASPAVLSLVGGEITGLMESQFADLDEPGTESLIERGQMSSCVQQIVQRLPETYRIVILLHDVHGLTNLEIAKVLDCSLEAAKIQLHRARGKLKEALLQACEFSHDERGVFVCAPKPPGRQ